MNRLFSISRLRPSFKSAFLFILISSPLVLFAYPSGQYKGKLVLKIDNQRSRHPYETLKNPAYLQNHFSDGISIESRSSGLFGGKTDSSTPQCIYIRESANYSTFTCEFIASRPYLSSFKEIKVEIKHLWIPRYDPEDGKLYISLTSALRREKSSDYFNVVGAGSHIRSTILLDKPKLNEVENIHVRSYLFIYSLLLIIFLAARLVSTVSSLNVSFRHVRILFFQILVALALGELLLRTIPFSNSQLPSFSVYNYSKILVLLHQAKHKAYYVSQTKTKGFGTDLRDFAWRETYLQRGLDIPLGGPREGFRGQTLTFQRPCGSLSICWNPIKNNAIDIDSNGYQYSSACKSNLPSEASILIVGGSVAEGAHASFTTTTWWDMFATTLSQLYGKELCVAVLALGGAESDWELEAIKTHLSKYHTPVILAMNGLNDVVKRRTSNKHILRASAQQYVLNTAAAAAVSNSHQSLYVQVFQPSLFDKKNLSETERLLLIGYVPEGGHDPSAPERAFKVHLDYIANASSALDWKNTNHFFIDMRSVLAGEAGTLFGDIWHFQDPAHRILGQSLARRLASRLREKHSSFVTVLDL